MVCVRGVWCVCVCVGARARGVYACSLFMPVVYASAMYR